MKSIFAIIMSVAFITLPNTSFAQSLTKEIHQLCETKTTAEPPQTCHEKQQAALNEVQRYMNMMETGAGKYDIAQDPSYLSSLMTCLSQGVTDQGLTDYVVIDDCMKNFSLARAY